MFFKIFVFLKYEKTYCLAHFVHGLMDMRVVDFLAKKYFFLKDVQFGGFLIKI